LVATVGVVTPLAVGFGAMLATGEDAKVALFVAAALTATSVGITARVFGDLGALATTEARVVLGAAVADDVMGLVVLTVVVRLVTEGSVSILSVLGIVADLGSFARGAVLRDAAVLLVVAVVGKLVSPAGAIGTPGDKVLIGLGMLPRGEVGLIFATIGLSSGVLGGDLYAALLLVVL